ncbi:MAG TPA: pyridoxal kinase PdxY [Azospirillaceae bacterium]|nr:pyridoxal kinase PdxY [Azospirillaceae bacterium]
MKTILSIQSHVAYGYVGNRAAVFPLQRLGHDVMAVNTVQFSNHTGYGAWTGQVLGAEHIADIIDGIDERGGLAACDAVLSGYMGDAALGQVIVETVARVRDINPDAVYLCDPVMGDVGRGFFVRPGIPDFMRAHAVPKADIITPNQFELEYLTGHTVGNLDDALDASAVARRLGPAVVLLTSLTRGSADADTIEMLVDTAEGAWLVATPRLAIEPPPNGAGDAVAALFLAKFLETRDPAASLAHAAAAIFAVFDATRRAGTRELQLIKAQDELVNPGRTFQVERVR